MAQIYIKSLAWLIGLGGVGYGLMLLTEPSSEKINTIKSRSSYTVTDEEKKKVLFMQKLKEAAKEPPIYLQKTSNTSSSSIKNDKSE